MISSRARTETDDSLSTFASESPSPSSPPPSGDGSSDLDGTGDSNNGVPKTIYETLASGLTSAMASTPTSRTLFSPRLRHCSSSISARSSTHVRVGTPSRQGSGSIFASSDSALGFGRGDSFANDEKSVLEDNGCHEEDHGLEYGILISLQPQISQDARWSGQDEEKSNKLQAYNDEPPLTCQIQFCVDHNYRHIHPHVYAPASMLLKGPVEAVGGGGSGVQVFKGEMPVIGPVVMKHGGSSDLKELLALATISEELKRRSTNSDGNSDPKRATAAKDMDDRCPSFEFIYIGPHHFRKREPKVWSEVRRVIKSWDVVPTSSGYDASSYGEFPQLEACHPCLDVGSPKLRSRSTSDLPTDRSIKLCGCRNNSFSIQVHGDDCHALSFVLPSCHMHPNEQVVQLQGDGYESLKSVAGQLLPLMEEHLFKFTLGQSKIGSKNSVTGNSLLYAGKLDGKILDNLTTQMIQTVRNLQLLTQPHEVDVIETVRAELHRYEDENRSVNKISDVADSFVGNAIKKNFAATGRFYMLRKLGLQFRRSVRKIDEKNGDRHRIHRAFTEDKMVVEPLILAPEDVVPATHLGNLLRLGALMGDTFHDAPMEQTTLQGSQHSWRALLRRAVEPRPNQSKTSLERIWNCGLSDAGLHNLFVSEDELYFFDLGPPKYQSVPGFLTKYLFSFFHCLGMQPEDGKDRWKRRFVERQGKLALTEETQRLLLKAYDAFEICLDRLIDDLFEGDNSLRWLLVQYVTLQLLSDTAFCLQRWQIKGGGRPREENHQQDIDQWLWRALWDLYMAFHLNTQESWNRLFVTHPSQESSVFST